MPDTQRIDVPREWRYMIGSVLVWTVLIWWSVLNIAGAVWVMNWLIDAV